MIRSSLGKNTKHSQPSNKELELQDLRISKEKLESMAESYDLRSVVIEGYQYLLEGELKKSLEIFDDHLEKEKDNPVIWYGKGLISLLTKELDEALQFFEKAISFKPDFKDALFEKGVALHKKGRTKEAMEYWKRSREKERSY